MGVDLSHYRATIGSFIGKSSKEKKGVKNWFADRHEGSPDKLFCVSVFVLLSRSDCEDATSYAGCRGESWAWSDLQDVIIVKTNTTQYHVLTFTKYHKVPYSTLVHPTI